MSVIAFPCDLHSSDDIELGRGALWFAELEFQFGRLARRHFHTHSDRMRAGFK